MKRLLTGLFWFVLMVGVLAMPQAGYAVTFYNVSDDFFIQTSPLIVQGKVGFIESRKAADGSILTLIRIDVTETLKGSLTQSQLLLQQAGGQVGNEGAVFYGSPEFALNENVIVFLTQRADTYFEVNGMALGKFTIMADAAKNQTLQRQMDQVTVLAGPNFQKVPIGNSMQADDLKQKIKNSLPSGASQPALGNQPGSAQYLADLETSHSRPSLGYSFMSTPYRYFPTQADGATLYEMQINPANNPFGNATTARNVIQAGFDAWNNNSTSSITVNITGTTTAGGMDADHAVSFNDPYNEISPDPAPGNCSGVLGMGGSSYYLGGSGNTMVVNGQTFYRAFAGRITFNNGWTAAAGCSFLDDSKKLMEVAAHEVGHVIGLGHSADVNAIMYGSANGTKGNTLGADDVNGVTFIYPAVAAPVTYTITATAGAGGSIAPAGTVTVNRGASKTFAITPNAGYRIADVKVNGASVGAVPSYTFTNVTANQTIAATFDLIPLVTYTITAAAGVGGSIAPAGAVTVVSGANQTFTMTPAAGYQVNDVLVDNLSAGVVTSYIFTNVTADHQIAVSFRPTPATVTSYFGFEQYGGTWHDAEKSLTNPDDDWLCWAAAAANILDWTGWDGSVFAGAQDIFYNFQSYWTNISGLPEYGWNWWFDGTSQSPTGANWSQLKTAGGGDYWPTYNFFDYFKQDWAWDSTSGQWGDGSELMDTIETYLRSGYGTTLAVYTNNGGHALTAWGYEYNAAGAYTGLWVTDSDDYAVQMKLLPVTLDTNKNLWYLGSEYNGWFIGGVEALDRRTETPAANVPEPGTLLLVGFGLLGLLKLARKKR